MQKRELLINYKLDRILYCTAMKDGFHRLKAHRLALIEQEKQAKLDQIKNFKALKFWCKKTKRKVYQQGFKKFIYRCQLKRHNAMRAYMFLEGKGLAHL